MSFNKFLLAGCAAFTLSATAQTGTDPVLMTVDGQAVTRSEFEAIYKKNNKDAPVTREALDEYLDLFINYKLKVRAAEALGMDTISKFKQELDGYRKQLARPYLIDRELNDQLIQEAYARQQKEVRASHILVQVAPDAAPADTLAAWNRLMALRGRIEKGEDFASVAQGKGGSDDPSAQKNGGDLGWFSVLQMVYPFENAAYATKTGELSMPIRTRFGYHVIKKTGERDARGTMKAAHIMLRAADGDTTAKSAMAAKKIEEIHALVTTGNMPFNEAALKYSEDEGSSGKGGELPEFTTGKMIEEFEDVAFALPANGDISKPFKTRYGWHIVKRLSYTAPPSFDQAKGDLKNRISRDQRAEITRKVFLEKLKKGYAFSPQKKNMKKLLPLVNKTIFLKGAAEMDTLLRSEVVEGPLTRNGMSYRREVNATLKNGKAVNIRSKKHEEVQPAAGDTVVVRDVNEGWMYDRAKAAKLTKTLFTLDGKAYTQRDFLDHLEQKQRREPEKDIPTYANERFNEWVDETVLNYEDSQLEKKYPEFRMLMKEYRDGILLFELTDQKVWSKAVKDSTGLAAYHASHTEQFMWPTRYECDIYSCASPAVAKTVRTQYAAGKRGADLMALVNKTSSLDLSIDGGTFTAEEKPWLAGLTNTGLSNNFDVDGRTVIVDMKRVIPPTAKTLDECRGLVTAAYQDALEKEWIAELRAKYPVKTDTDVLYSIR